MRIEWILILGALALAACGGGGGAGDETRTVALPSDPDLDGCLRSDGRGAWPWVPGLMRSLTGELYDGVDYLDCRQFYTFDLSGLPAGARIEHATLRLYQVEVVGNPYGSLGDVVVDRVHFEQAILAAYFDGNNLDREIGTLSTDAALGYREVVVTSAVRADLADGRTRSQFRVRVDLPGLSVADGRSDFVRFTDAEGSAGDTAHPPVLVLTYTAP